MAKKTFEGEGNPSSAASISEFLDPRVLKSAEPVRHPGKSILISEDELRVLKVLLDRDRTSRLVHGGLKSLLTLSDDDVRTLLNFLERV